MSVTLIDPTQLKNGSGPPASGGFIFAANYDFTAQTPGGSLIIGSNTVTLHPVPAGVNGTDTDHYVYISGGSGTAEAVLITGGTAVSAAPSGTIIFTCAHTHSGAWTIKSATAGGQEAHSVAVAGSLIQFPAGANYFYGPMTVTKSELTVQGTGTGSVLYQNTLSFGLIVNTLNGFGSQVRDLTCSYNGSAQSGVAAVTFQGTAIGDIFWPQAINLKFNSVAVGIRFVDAQYFRARDIFSQSYSENCVESRKLYGSHDGGDSRIQDCTFGGGVASIYLSDTPVVIMTGNKYNGGQYAFHGVDSGGFVIGSSSLENHTTAGILIEGTVANAVLGGIIDGCLIDQNSDIAWGGIILAPFDANAIKNIIIKNNLIGGLPGRTHTQTGVFFGGSSTATNVSISGTFAGLTTAVNVSAGCTNIAVTEYNLGTGGDALDTPFALSNTETTLKPNAPVTFAELTAMGTVRDGSQAYVSDGQATSPTDNTLIGGGSGALGVRIASAWRVASGTGGGIPLTITGTQDGSNTAFTASGSVGKLFRNGLLLAPTIDYTAAGTAITMVIPPAAPDILLAFSI